MSCTPGTTARDAATDALSAVIAFLRTTNCEDFTAAAVKHSGNEQMRGIATKFYDSLVKEVDRDSSSLVEEVADSKEVDCEVVVDDKDETHNDPAMR